MSRNRSAEISPLLQRYYSLESIVNDPWREDSVLYLPNSNQYLLYGANSLATFLYLKQTNASFTIRNVSNSNEMSPSGKGPVLKCGKYIIGEYEAIVNFCNLKNIALCKSANEEKKAYLSLIENQFSDIIGYFLFKLNDNKKSINSVYASVHPWPLNILIYYSDYYFMRNKLCVSGLWKLDRIQVLNRFDEILMSFDRKLKNNEYIVENRLSEVDLLLYSYIKIIYNHNEFNEIANFIKKYNFIKLFYENLNKKYSYVINSSFDKYKY